MSEKAIAGLGAAILVFLVGLTGAGLWGCPEYNVWQSRKAGQAELAHAEFQRQVIVQEAHAKMEAAKNLAEAEVIRADGVAKANKIIGQSLHDNEAYLRYLWIHSLQDGKNEVIYVPTEANLPILEAKRLEGKR